MKMKKKWLALMLTITMTAGCSQTIKVSAEEMVSNAITSSKEVEAYYAEASMLIYENDELQSEIIIKEYVNGDGVKKIITEDKTLNQKAYALNDGKQMIMYEETAGQAYSMDVSALELPSSSPKDQFVMMLEGMKNSHSQQIVGEEKLNGFDTAHIKLIPNEKNDFLGEMDLWVDQKTWFIIKFETISGDSKSLMEYKTIDLSPKFEEGTFELDIPDSVVITPMEDLMKETEITLEEAETILEKPFLLIPEGDFSIDTITLTEINGDIEREEVNVSYSNLQGPAFTVTVFETPEEEETILQGNKKLRNKDAEYSEELQYIVWDEDGLRYSVLISNPEMKIDEFIKLAEKMVVSSKDR